MFDSNLVREMLFNWYFRELVCNCGIVLKDIFHYHCVDKLTQRELHSISTRLYVATEHACIHTATIIHACTCQVYACTCQVDVCGSTCTKGLSFSTHLLSYITPVYS